MNPAPPQKRALSFTSDADLRAIDKIRNGCRRPDLVRFSGSAVQDMLALSITRQDVFDAVLEHIDKQKLIECGAMRNGDWAYIFSRCSIQSVDRYVKLKFEVKFSEEYMVIFSVHEN